MKIHPHLNRKSNRLFKRDNKIIRDAKKSVHNKIPLLNPYTPARPPLKLNSPPKKQYSSVPSYTPAPNRPLPPRNQQNKDFDGWCIIL